MAATAITTSSTRPRRTPNRCPAGETLTWRFTTVEAGKTNHIYWTDGCSGCALKAKCTTGKQRRVRRCEHEAVLEAVAKRLEATPEAMRVRRSTIEHAFGTLKQWMGEGAGGPNHFLTKGLKSVSAEMSLAVLAYNLKRTIGIIGAIPLVAAIRT